ncbi:MAG: DM13 domain-containing protein [Pseudomonadota bacterium]
MKKILVIVLIISHLSVGLIGFALGIYILPILIAPEAPTISELNEISSNAKYSAEFSKDLKDSDAFHWGEGKVFIGDESISLIGELAPGPDYKLYLSPEFIETENKFNELKSTMVKVGDVNTFNNFVVQVPSDIDPSKYNTVIIWCEGFGEFITSAKYK